jgi:hypothetical protein
MDREEKELLKKTVQLEEENNDMLHAIRRSMRLSHIMSVIYWAFVIGSLVGAFYFIQPYFEKVMTVYKSARGSIDSGTTTFNSFIESFNKK